jgi:prepilin-type N-terminal cleavage/methylation domain-containing protein
MSVRYRAGFGAEGGYSLVELMTVMALFGVIAASGLPHFEGRRQDVNNVLAQVIGDLRFARGRSITTGTHFALRMLEEGGYQIERMELDDGEWVESSVAKAVVLPPGITLTIGPEDVDLIEFNTRGMMVSSDASIDLTVEDTVHDATHVLSIWPSGQIAHES